MSVLAIPILVYQKTKIEVLTIDMEEKSIRKLALDLAEQVKKNNPDLFDLENEAETYFKVSRAALYDPTLDCYEQRLYSIVASLAQAYGVCFASQDTIGQLSGMKQRTTVSKILNRLEHKKFIKSARIEFKQKIYLIVSSCKRYPFLNEMDASGLRKKRDSFEYLMSEQYRADIDRFIDLSKNKSVEDSRYLEDSEEVNAGGMCFRSTSPCAFKAHPHVLQEHIKREEIKEIKIEDKKERETGPSAREQRPTASNQDQLRPSASVEESRPSASILTQEENVLMAAEKKESFKEEPKNEIILAQLDAFICIETVNNMETEMVSRKEVEGLLQKSKQFTDQAHDKKLVKEAKKKNSIPSLKSGSGVICASASKTKVKEQKEDKITQTSYALFSFYKQQIFENKGFSVPYTADKKILGMIKRNITKYGYETLEDMIAWALKNWSILVAKNYRFKNTQATLDILMTSSNIDAILMIKAEEKNKHSVSASKTNSNESEISKNSWKDIFNN